MPDEKPFPGRTGSMTPERFDAFYAARPPWEIGAPQPAFAALAADGRLTGRVLDSGCGTGEHALMTARLGLDSTGVDIIATAVARGEAKSAGLPVTFVVADVLRLSGLAVAAEPFDTVLDSGVFHVFGDDDRERYAAELHAVTKPGGRLFLLCFSDREPGTWGPRRIAVADLRLVFGGGWDIVSVTDSSFTLYATAAGGHDRAEASLMEAVRR